MYEVKTSFLLLGNHTQSGHYPRLLQLQCPLDQSQDLTSMLAVHPPHMEQL